jgi:hypothetical protein
MKFDTEHDDGQGNKTKATEDLQKATVIHHNIHRQYNYYAGIHCVSVCSDITSHN